MPKSLGFVYFFHSHFAARSHCWRVVCVGIGGIQHVISFIHRWRLVIDIDRALALRLCCVLYKKLTKRNNLCGGWVVWWLPLSAQAAVSISRRVGLPRICGQLFISVVNVCLFVRVAFTFLLMNEFENWMFLLHLFALPVSRDHPFSFQFRHCERICILVRVGSGRVRKTNENKKNCES